MLIGIALTATLMLYALRSNIDLFYTPGEILQGKGENHEKPEVGQRLRIGGMVMPGSVKRDPYTLQVSFKIYDARGAIGVTTPAFCRTCSAKGRAWWRRACWARATWSMRAKCWPNTTKYTPPEVADAMKENHKGPAEAYNAPQARAPSHDAGTGRFSAVPGAGDRAAAEHLPAVGRGAADSRMMAVARPLTYGMFAAIALAFLCLVHAFVVNDFTVAYVATNSNTQLPVYYRIAATWGA